MKKPVSKKIQKQTLPIEEVVKEAVENLWAPYELVTTVHFDTDDIDRQTEKIPHLFELSDYVAHVFALLNEKINIKEVRSDLMKAMFTHDKYYFKNGFEVNVGVSLTNCGCREILTCEFEGLSQVRVRRVLAAAYSKHNFDKIQRRIDSLFC